MAAAAAARGAALRIKTMTIRTPAAAARGLPPGIAHRVAAVKLLQRVERHGAFLSLAAKDLDQLEDGGAAAARHATDLAAGCVRNLRLLDYLIEQLVGGPPEEGEENKEAGSSPKKQKQKQKQKQQQQQQQQRRRRRPKLETPVRNCLRMGLYELLFTAAPPHASVHSAVETVRACGTPRAAGLVNAVLRRCLRTIGDDKREGETEAAAVAAAAALLPPLSPEAKREDMVHSLGVRFSQPDWIVRRFLDAFAFADTVALLEWCNARPVHSLRYLGGGGGGAAPAAEECLSLLQADIAAARQRASELGELDELGQVVLERSRLGIPGFVRVLKGLQSLQRLGIIGGAAAWTVQDEGAGAVVAAALDPQPGQVVVDTCAAPGGKALNTLARLRGSGRLYAIDRSDKRLDLLRRAAAASKLDATLECIAGELQSIAEEVRRRIALHHGQAGADCVLVDAPCSGLGVLSKRADLRWNRSEKDCLGLVSVQLSLLRSASSLVRPGGVLVYSTCTIERRENRDVVMAFLESEQGRAFTLDAITTAAAAGAAGGVSADGMLELYPHKHGVDGAFAARMRRQRQDDDDEDD